MLPHQCDSLPDEAFKSITQLLSLHLLFSFDTHFDVSWNFCHFKHRDSQTTSNSYNKNRECVKCCHKSRQSLLSTSPAALRLQQQSAILSVTNHWIIKVILKVEIWKKEKSHLYCSNLTLNRLRSMLQKVEIPAGRKWEGSNTLI